MVSPSQQGQDPPRANPYLGTPAIPTPESQPESQYTYMNHYYANMYNQNGFQASSTYSTPYSTSTATFSTDIYDRYRESGMINRMGPILLSLICPKYQDLPSKSNPLFAIRLYVGDRINESTSCHGGGLHNSILTCSLLGPISVVQRSQHPSSFALCPSSTSRPPACAGFSSRPQD